MMEEYLRMHLDTPSFFSLSHAGIKRNRHTGTFFALPANKAIMAFAQTHKASTL
jgi:hypothetical protein